MKTRVEMLHKNKLNTITNVMLIVGLILIAIPSGFWMFETYSQWSEVKSWESLVSLNTDEAIRALRFSEHDNALAASERHNNQKPSSTFSFEKGDQGWNPRLVDTGTVAPGTSVALIDIPNLKIKLGILEGESWTNLAKGPVHVTSTAKIGAIGNALVSGHRTMYGAPFNQLHKLALGDKIVIYTKKAVFVYSVDGIKRVKPDDWTDIDKETDIPRLVLSTCDPMYSAQKRLLILAKLEQAKKLGTR